MNISLKFVILLLLFNIGKYDAKLKSLTKYYTYIENNPNIINYMSIDKIKEIIKKSFTEWSDHIPLDFIEIEKKENADIIISFEQIDIELGGKTEKFLNNICDYIESQCKIVINDALSWNNKPSLIYEVMLHEIGHVIGLDHIEDKYDSRYHSIMKMKVGYINNPHLFKLDIIQAQKIYGKREKNDLIYSNNEICTDKIKTIIRINENIFIFKKDYYYKLDKYGYLSTDDNKHLISSYWKDLYSDIDGGFHYEGYTYFFKNNLYWKYDKNEKVYGYPKNISEGFDYIPNNLNSIILFGDIILFFKENTYISYDIKNNCIIKRPMSTWVGIPHDFDAVIFSYGYFYFFKDELYYKFNIKTFNVEKGFPKLIKEYWFGCKRNIPIHI